MTNSDIVPWQINVLQYADEKEMFWKTERCPQREGAQLFLLFFKCKFLGIFKIAKVAYGPYDHRMLKLERV